MNFVADESVDLQIVARLRLDGHLVSYLAEMAPGISDKALLERGTKGLCFSRQTRISASWSSAKGD